VAQWLRWRTCAQQAWVPFSLIPTHTSRRWQQEGHPFKIAPECQ